MSVFGRMSTFSDCKYNRHREEEKKNGQIKRPIKQSMSHWPKRYGRNEQLPQSINRSIVAANPDFVAIFSIQSYIIYFPVGIFAESIGNLSGEKNLPNSYEFSRLDVDVMAVHKIKFGKRCLIILSFDRLIDWMNEMFTNASTFLKQMMRRLLDWSCSSSVKKVTNKTINSNQPKLQPECNGRSYWAARAESFRTADVFVRNNNVKTNECAGDDTSPVMIFIDARLFLALT